MHLTDDGVYMTKGEKTAVPQWAGPWTGADGTAHIRNAGTGATFCGIEGGAYAETRPAGACDACIAASLATFAGNDACVPECRR